MKKKALWIILLMALILRATLPLASYLPTGTTEQFHAPDSKSYVNSATSLLETGKFSQEGVPEICRTPGYPLFLIPGLLSGHLNLVTLCLQILVSVFTVYLVYLTTLKILDDIQAALISATFYTIEPLSVLYGTQILTETLFTALIMLFAYFVVLYLRFGTRNAIIWAALAITSAAYVRPAAYFLPLLTALFLFFRSVWLRTNLKRVIGDALIFFALCIILVGAWQIRNYDKNGYSGFSSMAVENLYFVTVPQILAAKHGGDWKDWRNELGWVDEEAYFAKHPEQRNWGPAQIIKWRFEQARAYILNNYTTFGKLYFIGTARTILGRDVVFRQLFWNDASPSIGAKQPTEKHDTLDSTPSGKIKLFLSLPLSFIIIQIFFLIILALTYLTSVYGTLAAFKIRPYEICFILFLVAYLIAVPCTLGYSRFRAPAVPLICVLSGYGLLQIMQRLRSRSLKHIKVSV